MQDFIENEDNVNLKTLESQLRDIENWANEKLEERGVLFSSEIYEKLRKLNLSE